ncbi:MAG: DNA-binding protein WhiA [Lachnospiraceae bacterium]|nr:DNA-binding protein WhiA [Lachnospiraceae bacterium]
MSFSTDVKSELAGISPQKKDAAAELCAIFSAKELKKDPENAGLLCLQDENFLLVKKVFTILKKSFNIRMSVFVRNVRKRNKVIYGLELCEIRDEKKLNEKLQFRKTPSSMAAYLRGAFIACGSVNDPKRSYHLEFLLRNEKDAEKISEMISGLGYESRSTKRKGETVVYIKDSSVISEMLAVMGAGVSMMNYENERAMNETRGVINRRVNCELGNLRKSTEAGQKQLSCIGIIRDHMGLDNLPDGLKEIAELRINNPEASLQELGEMMDPPLGRSGVNHRLQKLLGIAENITVHLEEM